MSFKRQRYHCVYEYPRELSDSDGSEFADSPSRRRMWDLEGGTYNLQGTVDSIYLNTLIESVS